MEFTEKQKEQILRLKNKEFKRLNIFYGSVRSGKTHIIGLVVFPFWLLSMPKNKYYLMVAKTLRSLERNCLEPLMDIIGNKDFDYSIQKKRATLFGRRIFLEGANDVSSESKIRGVTLSGAYMDEVTLCDEKFFRMMLSRLSDPGAKFFGTTNPDSPDHWLKTDFIDRKEFVAGAGKPPLDILVDKFTIDQNTMLDPVFVENLKNEYSGVYYDRFILGDFVRAEGLVFPFFSNNTHEFLISDTKAQIEVENNKMYKIILGVDFGGSSSKTKFTATAISDDYVNLITLEEHIVKSNENIDTETICLDFYNFTKKITSKYGDWHYAFCDSASPTMINSLRSYFKQRGERYNNILSVTKTPVTDRPRTIDKLFNTGRLKISENCPRLIHALQNLIWDPKKENYPEDDNIGNINDDYDSFCYTWIEFSKRIESK